jgi:putative sterol carrier protein
MKLFSEEWVNTLVENLKNSEDFQKKGKGFDSNFQFKLLKDSKANVTNDIGFGMWFPTCDPFWYGTKADMEVDIILEAKAGIFAEVFSGKRNVVMALTMGTLRLKKGQLTKLTANLGAVNQFVKVAGEVL